MTARALLLATTVIYRDRFADTPYTEHPFPSDVETVMAADELAEFAGRSCYGSWNRPNPNTATNHDYIRSILVKEHYSVLEHASATFWITGISRSLTHELIRHRHLSYSQLSQRFVDSREAEFVTPPAMVHDEDMTTDLAEHFADSVALYEDFVDILTEKGYSRKEAREAARAVLPNCTETTLVVTGNMRTWREVIEKRIAPGADAEIRSLAGQILRQLKQVAPNTFMDIGYGGAIQLVPDEEAEPIGSAFLVPDAIPDELSSALQLSADVRAA